ncbi:unnamed protein product [Mycena citricolor]|uniref:Metallo-beta-lactamase domain-containing protein n=1 Tax=Mycena citricolor TaxID=2018698 RepID=A0AAD2JYD2_9AGAR|nr:unnamed protein product [Mycena citricolor]
MEANGAWMRRWSMSPRAAFCVEEKRSPLYVPCLAAENAWLLSLTFLLLLSIPLYRRCRRTSSYGQPSYAFTAIRLTPTTFMLTEYDDIFDEHPQIFVKVVSSANTVLIIDSGCGGKSARPAKTTSLRTFIEKAKLDCNGGVALNEGGRMDYVVVATHCHYDHILGIEQFTDSPILVSGHDASFISPKNLPAHSLCQTLGLKTPQFKATLVSHAYQIRSVEDVPLNVQVLHTPGHTPDEVALYDYSERMLYVGDTVYEVETIIFPSEGSIVQWMDSMQYLIAFVREQSGQTPVQLNAGHRTYSRPAMDVLIAARTFIEDVIAGREQVKDRMRRRGEENIRYEQGEGRFALLCPERLVLEARDSGVAYR